MKQKVLNAQCPKCKKVETIDDKKVIRWQYCHVILPSVDKRLCYPCSIRSYTPSDTLKV